MIGMVKKAHVMRAARIFRAHGISQAEMAEFVGASQPQISRILKGEGIRATKLAEEV
ncbi:helix-turn-helix domain-containing protein [Dechloromonas sp. CZR5]|uniref:helix-turn-helix domain-containing protein n=1 Tax=Dechloromonas sp. CZR5 TaxID=2608630 RepID=UPI00351A82E2